MNSFEEIFALMKSNLDVTDVFRKNWIEPITPIGLNNNTVILHVPSPFVRQVLQENVIELFKRNFKEILGFEVDINIQCDKEEENKNFGPIPELEDDVVMVQKLHNSVTGSNYKYTFDTFIEGASNKLAYAACKAVAEGLKNYNPLYIYSNPGLGKTHLLNAVKNEILKNNPDLKIVFVVTDTFIDDYVSSVKSGRMTDFKNKYRTADVLLMDDIQFIAGKSESQQELFNTFNELHSNNKQIIFTSDRSPKEINAIDQRLQSRFEWGLLADISIPEFETRLAIIQRKAKLMNLNLHSNITEYMADKLKNNIRQLEGAIIKINAMALVQEVTPTMAMARDVVKEVLDENIPSPVTIEKVINEVASTYGLTNAEIRSKKRSANISTARQIAIYIVHKITKLSYVEIGKEFGDRDHSTIVYAINKVKEIVQKDKAYRNTIEDLIKNIGNL